MPSEQQLKPLPDEDKVDQPQFEDHTKHVRGFNIFRRDILKRQQEHGDGFTPHCPGCAAARRNAAPRAHSSACRAKYRGILLQDERAKVRIEAADGRTAGGVRVSASAEPASRGVRVSVPAEPIV